MGLSSLSGRRRQFGTTFMLEDSVMEMHGRKRKDSSDSAQSEASTRDTLSSRASLSSSDTPQVEPRSKVTSNTGFAIPCSRHTFVPAGTLDKISSAVGNNQVVSDMQRRRLAVRRVVKNPRFDVLSGLMILGNMVLIGAETEYLTSHQDTHPVFFVLQYLFNMWLILELALRMIGDGCNFFYSQDWRWNFFDLGLVVSSSIDMFVEALHFQGVMMGRSLRAVRLMRMVRVLHMYRSLRYLHEFRKMMILLGGSVRTWFSSLLLVGSVVYTFGVWFTQTVSEWRKAQDAGSAERAAPNALYGSLAASMYTLYQVMTGGNNWGVLIEPLLPMDPYIPALFIVFVSVSIFAVLNIVTSVFVESVVQSSQHYRDLLVHEQLAAKEVYVKHMREIFRQIDNDGSGNISLNELARYLDDEELQQYFEALDIQGSEAKMLFRLLDHDNSGTINIDEFCDGCMRLKGLAKSFDINCMIHEHRRVLRLWTKFMQFVEDGIGRLERQLDTEHRPGAKAETCHEPLVGAEGVCTSVFSPRQSL